RSVRGDRRSTYVHNLHGNVVSPFIRISMAAGNHKTACSSQGDCARRGLTITPGNGGRVITEGSVDIGIGEGGHLTGERGAFRRVEAGAGRRERGVTHHHLAGDSRLTASLITDDDGNTVCSLFRIRDRVISINAEGVTGDQLDRACRSMGLAIAIVP